MPTFGRRKDGRFYIKNQARNRALADTIKTINTLKANEKRGIIEEWKAALPGNQMRESLEGKIIDAGFFDIDKIVGNGGVTIEAARPHLKALEEGKVLPPVTVVPKYEEVNGKVRRVPGKYFLADGWHRLAASKALGLKQIRGVLIE